MGRTRDFFKKYRRVLIVIGRVLSVAFSLLLVLLCNMFKSINTENFNLKVELIKNMKDPLTWILSISIALAWAVIYFVVYTTCKEKKLADNQPLFVKYETLNKSKCNNFRDFIKTVVNVKRKKDAYYEKMENELAKVQLAMEKIPVEKSEGKRMAKLKSKEQEIIRKSTPEYIEQHFISLSVKYNRVKLEHFTFAITTGKTTDQTFSNEKRRLYTKLAGRIVTGVLLGMCGISILGTLKGIFEWKDTGLWITLIVILITIFIQIYMATDDADVIVNSEIIAPTLTKIEIIEESLLWKDADMKNKPLEKLIDNYVAEQNKVEEEKKPVKISLAQLQYLEKHKEEIDKKIEEEMKGEEAVDRKEEERLTN